MADKVHIAYCGMWGYKPRAVALAGSLKSRFGVNVEISPGNTGDFEVRVDGQKLYSKQSLGRFPNPGEVEDLFAELSSKG